MKNNIIATFVLILTGFSGISQAGSFALQGNLESLTYYTSSVPFKDMMFQALRIGLFKTVDNKACRVTPAYDANGYPKNVPKDCYFLLIPGLHINRGANWAISPTLKGVLPFKRGRYIFTYTGVGDFIFEDSGTVVLNKKPGRYELNVQNPGIQGFTIKVKNYGSPYPQDFHLVHEDEFATYQDQPFNPTFLAALTPYQILRFMDWGKTNDAIFMYESKNLPNANLSPSSLKLGGNASNVANFYTSNMVATVKVNGKFQHVMLSGYDSLTKTIKFATPVPVPTDGLPISVVIRDYYNRTWGSRTPLSPILQTSQSGVAFEYMIELANITKKTPWFTIPTAADDGFVNSLLTLIENKLDKNLKAYIEYSNETWNSVFPQYNYSEAMQQKLGLNNISSTIIPADAFHSYRATQIFRMASQIRREPELRVNRTSSRFVRVLASQAAWPERAKSVMDWGLTLTATPTFNHAAQEYADVIAIAPYFARPNGDATNLTTATHRQLFDIQKRAIDEQYGTNLAPGSIRQQAINARQRGIKLVQYEGGTHLLDNKTNSLATLTNLVTFNRSSLMYDLYSYNLSKWKALENEFGSGVVGNFSQFQAIGSPSKYGYWGTLESAYQLFSSSPKYRALSEFAANP